jgi:hypothetical protein
MEKRMPLCDSETPVRESDASGAPIGQPDRNDESGSLPPARGGRKLAVVASYYELVDALRKRVLELGTDYEEVGRGAGDTETYTSKLLAPRPSRNFGEVSLGSMLGTSLPRICVSLPQPLRDQLEQLAEQDRRPLATFVRLALQDFADEQRRDHPRGHRAA